MDEKFHQSSELSSKKMAELSKRSNQPATGRFILLYSLYIASSFAIILTWFGPLWGLTPSLFVYGVVCCSMFACLHETIHNTGFKTDSLNQSVAFLAGIAHIYPSTMIRELHFTHHRHTHVPGKDPEISLGNKPIPSVVSSLPSYLAWLSGFPLFMFKNFMALCGAFGMPEPIRRSVFPFVRTEVRLTLFLNSVIVVGVQTTFILLAIYVDSGFWGLFIGQVIGHCFLASYTAAEHNGLPHEGNIMERTRSIRASKLVNFIMWNMPYHAEHHAYPSIPFHALPQLHQAIHDEIIHKDKDHPTFHWLVLKKTTVGNAKVD